MLPGHFRSIQTPRKMPSTVGMATAHPTTPNMPRPNQTVVGLPVTGTQLSAFPGHCHLSWKSCFPSFHAVIRHFSRTPPNRRTRVRFTELATAERAVRSVRPYRSGNCSTVSWSSPSSPLHRHCAWPPDTSSPCFTRIPPLTARKCFAAPIGVSNVRIPGTRAAAISRCRWSRMPKRAFRAFGRTPCPRLLVGQE